MLGKADQTTAVAAASIAASAPLLGTYAGIVIAALFGALVALSRASIATRLLSALFIFRAVSISAFTTGLASKVASHYIGLGASDLVIPLAFVIAWVGDDWFKIKGWVLDRAKHHLDKEGGDDR